MATKYVRGGLLSARHIRKQAVRSCNSCAEPNMSGSFVTKWPPLFGGEILPVQVTGTYPLTNGTNINSGQTENTEAFCSSGTVPAGGGLYYQAPIGYTAYDGSGNIYLLDAAAGGWQEGFYASPANGTVPMYPTVAAVCLSFS
jgi:hypothetical protein